ncbi:MAG: ankyrin repeat domain-containing protein [Methylacidiphilales bacterium]|nr:ankyrin repeat domain-containing protein [Candidatus Methylacidiphilales bacterium]
MTFVLTLVLGLLLNFSSVYAVEEGNSNNTDRPKASAPVTAPSTATPVKKSLKTKVKKKKISKEEKKVIAPQVSEAKGDKIPETKGDKIPETQADLKGEQQPDPSVVVATPAELKPLIIDRAYWRDLTKEEAQIRIAIGEINKKSLTETIGSFGETPLHLLLAWNQNIEVVDLILSLFEADTTLSIQDTKKNDLIHYAISTNPNPQVVKLLVTKFPTMVYKRLASLDNPINLASSVSANGEIINILTEVKAEVDIRNESGHTAYHLAALNNNEPSIFYSLNSSGFNSLSRDKSQFTALHLLAARSQNHFYIRSLISAGGDVLSRDGKLQTPLHMAAKFNQSSEVTLALLQSGAQVEAKDIDGNTPLLLAVMHNPDPIIIYALINAGANFNAWNKKGQDVFDVSKKLYPDGALNAYLVACASALKNRRPCLPLTDKRLIFGNRIDDNKIATALHQNRNLLDTELYLNSVFLQMYKYPSNLFEVSPSSTISDWKNLKLSLIDSKKLQELDNQYHRILNDAEAQINTVALALLKNIKDIEINSNATSDEAFYQAKYKLEQAVDDCDLDICTAIQYFLEFRDSSTVEKGLASSNLHSTTPTTTTEAEKERSNQQLVDSLKEVEDKKTTQAMKNETDAKPAATDGTDLKKTESEAAKESFDSLSSQNNSTTEANLPVDLRDNFPNWYLNLVADISKLYHSRFQFSENYNKDYAIDPLQPPSYAQTDAIFQSMLSSTGLELFQDIIRNAKNHSSISSYLRKRPLWLTKIYSGIIQPELLSQ